MIKIVFIFLFIIAFFPSCKKYTEIGKKDDLIVESSEYFVLLGDIQKYTGQSGYYNYYENTLLWISSQNRYYKNFKCVIQTGDLTDNNYLDHWALFQKPFKYLNEIPIICCVGNHDYDWDTATLINDRNSCHLNDFYFNSDVKNGIAYSFEKKKLENFVTSVTVFDDTLFFLVLEFGARKEVVDWAKRIVSDNPDKRFILLTHEFLSSDGKRISSGSSSEAQLRNTTFSSPEDIWQQLVYCNPNIICVICGHNGFSQQLLSVNCDGDLVPQILFNLQYQENGGDGLVQLWRFSLDSDIVSVCTYNTIKRVRLVDPLTCFEFKYK